VTVTVAVKLYLAIKYSDNFESRSEIVGTGLRTNSIFYRAFGGRGPDLSIRCREMLNGREVRFWADFRQRLSVAALHDPA
jgi:hypothetical protein